MAPFMEDVQCAVLSANIRPDDTLAATFGASCLPYKIFTMGGEKVGVVGYTSQETPALSRPGTSKLIVDHFLPLRDTSGHFLVVRALVELHLSSATSSPEVSNQRTDEDISAVLACSDHPRGPK